MPASSASVSSDPAGGRLLIVGVNWLGDAIMSMPALQALRARAPAAHIALLTKPPLLPLWRMHAAPSELLTLAAGWRGLAPTVAAVRAGRFDAAYVLPNSFRSALIPWLARVPERTGFRGHFRRALLTRVFAPPPESDGRHQAQEILQLLAPGGGVRPLAQPRLTPPPDAVAAAQRRCCGLPRPLIALLPGAARGPSKRWPGPHFAALGRLLRDRLGATVLLLGASAETKLCAELARAIGAGAHNLAGQTALPELAALLQAGDLVIGNDSGGLHLAAAVGAPAVVLFGITDPGRTAPLGSRVKILQRNPGGARDVPRASRLASASLAALRPEEVLAAAMELLAAGRAGPESSAAKQGILA